MKTKIKLENPNLLSANAPSGYTGSQLGSPIDRPVVLPTSQTDSQCFDELPHGRTRKDSQYTRGQLFPHDHNRRDPQSTAGKKDLGSPHVSNDTVQDSHGRSSVLPTQKPTGGDSHKKDSHGRAGRQKVKGPNQETVLTALRSLSDPSIELDQRLNGSNPHGIPVQLSDVGLTHDLCESDLHSATSQSTTVTNGNLKPPSVAGPSFETGSCSSTEDPRRPSVVTKIVTDPQSIVSPRRGPSHSKTPTGSDTNEDPGTAPVPPPIDSAVSHSYLLLGFYGDMLDDFEALRIATTNRRRALTDPSEHGHGLSVLLPEIGIIDSSLMTLDAIEHEIELNLKRAMRKHPLGPWVKATIGIGEKQMARLLGVIGDPGVRETVKQLNAYCGMDVRDGHAPRRTKGEKSNWNDKARSRLYVIAESCIKQARSPYRVVYDNGRVKYRDVMHEQDCRQCKVTAGEPLSLGHQHARAMRLVMKAILLDLWRESVRLKSNSIS